MDYAKIILALTPAVYEAGKAIMRIKQEGPTNTIKADGSPLTIADQEAEKIILNALSEYTPNVPIVSEENEESHNLKINSRFFLVDPLDGTKEFLKSDNNGAFTVNIGLIENNLPVMGIVYAPAKQELYWGFKGGGAFLEKDSRITSISVRDLPDNNATAVASASHLDETTSNWLSSKNIDNITSIGSSLKFALVASGQADVYPRFGPTMEWDTAAGDAILRAAGGTVCHPNRQIFTYGKSAFKNTPFIAFGRGSL